MDEHNIQDESITITQQSALTKTRKDDIIAACHVERYSEVTNILKTVNLEEL